MLDPGFTTPEMSEALASSKRLLAMVAFEVALAETEASAGVIPESAASEIAEACRAWSPDLASLESAWSAGTPIIALTTAIKERMSTDAAQWVHYGATTQDVVDTATMLLAREALGVLRGDAVGAARLLSALSETNRAQPMIGRTFLQHARPTTFGMRSALWLNQLVAAIEQLDHARSSLPVQFGGPVGHTGLLGSSGPTVAEDLGRRLGLRAPTVSWPTDRSPVITVVQTVEQVVRACSKVASDLARLASTEISEVKLRSGASSSMPEKQNPLDALHCLAAANACLGLAGAVARGGYELERGLGGWQAEWFLTQLVFHTAGAAVAALRATLENLEVDTERMTAAAGQIEGSTLEATSAWIDRVQARFGKLDPDQLTLAN